MIGALGPDVEPAVGTAQAVLPHRRPRVLDLPVPLPVRRGRLDGRPPAVAARREQQHHPMEPYRAFIADKLPPSQLAKGFTQSFFTGFGITLANISSSSRS